MLSAATPETHCGISMMSREGMLGRFQLRTANQEVSGSAMGRKFGLGNRLGFFGLLPPDLT